MFREIEHTSDVCIVGAGMAGICAAIAAARNGAAVTLVNDRPVLGGNASEEIRMWICGAGGANMRETGIIEEIELENLFRNPYKNYSQWSALLYDKVKAEPNINLILNASVLDATTEAPPAPESDAARSHGDNTNEPSAIESISGPESREPDAPSPAGTRITSVRAWQTTTQRYHTVRADYFVDSSGDSILAPLTGAETRWGREAKDEFGESHAVDMADELTMGMSCLIQLKETDGPRQFVPPEFARAIERADVGPGRSMDIRKTNWWWIEAGGDRDSIHDTEDVRDDLLEVSTGIVNFIKRHEDDFDAKNWTVEWLGFLPGKRESRRYVGDHIISQSEVEASGPFADVVAYAGWSMDNHPPSGFYEPGEPTVYHPAPSPWGIPYRSLYSRNIANLWCAGRNISASHIALSSSRVMRTCSVIGQAVGTAVAIAKRYGVGPRAVGQEHIDELQQTLLYDDAYLPGIARQPDPAFEDATPLASNHDAEFGVRIARTVYETMNADGDPEPAKRGVITWDEVCANRNMKAVLNGVERFVDQTDHAWWARPGDSLTLELASAAILSEIRVVFDSNLSRYYQDHRMRYHYPLNYEPVTTAPELAKRFRIEIRRNSEWLTITEDENHQRLRRVAVPESAKEGIQAIRLTILETWGNDAVAVFGFDGAE